MKAIINGSKLKLEEMEWLSAGSIAFYELELETNEDWDNTTQKAIILKDGETVGNEIPVVENVVKIDREVEGKYYLGFVGFRNEFFKTSDVEIDTAKKYYILDNGDYIIVTDPVVADIGNYYESVITYQISTNLVVLVFDKGAGNVETEDISDEVPQASVFESYIAQINEVLAGAGNVNIDAIKVDGVVTITIMNKYGQSKTVTIEDGKDGKDGANGKDGKDGLNGQDGRNGVDGNDGFSPVVEVVKNTEDEYILKITYEGGVVITPNLRGKDGEKGEQGEQGEPGQPGQDGANGRDGQDGKDGVDGKDGKDGQNGQNGADGFSPTITVHTNTDEIYTLDITDKNGTTTTPNLKGQGGNVEIDILYNGKANSTAILSGIEQELDCDDIHNFDMMIIGCNADIGNNKRTMEITQTIYPSMDIMEYCDKTGAGATGAFHIPNTNINFNGGNGYRVMWGFTDKNHIRNIVSNPLGSWTNPGICYVVGYKFH